MFQVYRGEGREGPHTRRKGGRVAADAANAGRHAGADEAASVSFVPNRFTFNPLSLRNLEKQEIFPRYVIILSRAIDLMQHYLHSRRRR